MNRILKLFAEKHCLLLSFLIVSTILISAFRLEAKDNPSKSTLRYPNTVKKIKDPLRIAIDEDYPPHTFLNIDGQPAGIFVDIWKLWSQKTGQKIVFTTGDWNSSLTNLKIDKADIHSGLFKSESRARWMQFSQPFYKVGSYMFFRPGTDELTNIGKLEGKRIGVTLNSFQGEYLRKKYPKATVIMFRGSEEMIRAVLEMKIDYFLAEGPATTAFLDRLGLKGQFEISSSLFRESIHAGVLKGNKALLSLIEKGFNSISNKELAKIEKRWIPDPSKQYFKDSNTKIKLTEKERDWIKDHPSIRVGFPSDFPPLFFKEDKVIKGINPEYLELVSTYSGLKFSFIRIQSKSLDDYLKTAKIDMSVGFNIPERKSYAKNSLPFMNITIVVVGRGEMKLISGLSALNGKKIAVVRGIKIYTEILKHFPQIIQYKTQTFREAVEAVASGKADAVIAPMVMVGYLVRDFPTLKIVGLAGIEPKPYLYLIRSDFPELVSILDKTITAIPKEETNAIIHKWFKVQIEHQTNWKTILTWLCGITGVFIFILTIFLYWNKRLMREVTERRQVEKALRDSESKYRFLIENQTDMIVKFDKGGALLFASPSYRNTFTKSNNQLLGGSNLPLIHEQDRKTVAMAMESVLFPPYTAYFQGRAMTEKGLRWQAWLCTAILNKQEEVDSIIAVARDISPQKKAEEALRESEEKLARSKKMESLGLLAGGVAHDLNNVLSGVVSYPELLLLDLPADNKLRRPIEKIHESGLRAVAIVQDLLTVARGVATTKEALNVNDLINDYLNSPEFDNLKSFHPEVKFKTIFEEDSFNIKASYVHIRKALMNLVSNASEAIETNGNVTISTSNRYLDRPHEGYENIAVGEYVVMSVSDDGPGISFNDLGRIFDPFYTKKVMNRSGTGLGLAVAWNVVRDHKGYIDVLTDKNGTTFELYFPITRDEILDKSSNTPIEDLRGNGELILVVDDLDTQREISCKILTVLGYKSKSVASGEEALEYLKEKAVDLLLLDMIMDPGMSGRETYEQASRLRTGQKAIIASGYAETQDVKEAQKLGAGQYIKKPFTLEKLGLAIKEELQR